MISKEMEIDRKIKVLLEVIQILHPKKDVWRTPTDLETELIEKVINEAKELL